MLLNRPKVPIKLSLISVGQESYKSVYPPGDFNLPVGRKILEVLVTEKKDFALGSEQCKFVQSFLGESGNLDPRNFSPEVWAYVLDFDIGVEKIRLCWIRACAGVNVIYWRV